MWSYPDILFSRDPKLQTAITRLAPDEDKVEIDFCRRDGTSEKILQIEVKYREIYRFFRWKHASQYQKKTFSSKPIILTQLRPNQDYECVLLIKTAQGQLLRTPSRLFRTGKPIGTVVNYIHPDDQIYDFSGRYTCSPSIVKLPSGRILISHDVYKRGGGQNLTKIFYSDDDGRTFAHLTDLFPCFWGKLFWHRGALYMIATSTEYGALLISKSEDEGVNFLNPTELMPAGNSLKGGPHKAPMPVIEAKGRLWTGIDHGSWTRGGHASCIASVPVDADLLNAENWTISKPLPYDPNWKGTVQGTARNGLLEGNAVQSKNCEIFNILRYNTMGAIPNYGKAIILKVDENDLRKPLIFHKVIDFPGNMSKFTILYDQKSDLYVSLVNRVEETNVKQRNILTLIYSKDLYHWIIAQDIIRIPGNSHKVAAQYIDFIIDSNKIRIASRTAMNNANNFHNANYLTYHEIPNFREMISKEKDT